MFGRRKSLEMSRPVSTEPVIVPPRQTGKFHIFRGGDNQWYWHLKSRNGKILAQSEGYERKSKCLLNIQRIQKIAPHAVISFHE